MSTTNTRHYLVLLVLFVFDDVAVPRPSEKPRPCRHRRRLGRNVNRLRCREGYFLTQEELAEKVGVSTRYIQSIEAGDYWPSLPTLSKLLKSLKCSWNELLEGC